MTWRLLQADGVPAAAGLATDEMLCRQAGADRIPGGASGNLRLYTYRSHCALVGRFQRLANEVDLDYCDAHAIPVNRRPTGGGTILMGADQLGVALALPRRGADRRTARALMGEFAAGVTQGLHRLGIESAFRGKNDVEVSGKKIAGLGIYRDVTGGLLFHASVLLDLDVPLMARVLRTPFASIGLRELAILGRRTTTVREQSRSELAMDDLRRALASGFAKSFGVELLPGELQDHEVAASEAIETEKYATRGWLDQQAGVEDATGSAAVRTSDGTIEARVSLAGQLFKAVYLTGDFFADDSAIVDLEGLLRWSSSDPARVRAVIEGWSGKGTLDPDALATAIQRATELATATPTPSEPYGCFVSPRGAEVGRG